MKKLYTVLFVLSLCTLPDFQLKAQNLNKPSTNYFGGFTMQIPNKNGLGIFAGGSPEDKLSAFAVLPLFRLHKNFYFMPGYTYMQIKRPDDTKSSEHQFMPSIVFNIDINDKWIISNRVMYFHRLLTNQLDGHIYRNRFGVTHKTKIFNMPSRVFVHDAIFVNLENSLLVKNRLIFGVEMNAAKWLRPQFWYVLESNRGWKSRSMFYAIFSVPLENFGIFKPKEKKKEEAPPPNISDHMDVMQ